MSRPRIVGKLAYYHIAILKEFVKINLFNYLVDHLCKNLLSPKHNLYFSMHKVYQRQDALYGAYRNLTLPQLAKEMKVPMHHIQKCFKEVHKTTFVDFKTGYKIQWAVEALYDPSFKNDTIDSIGACAGFNSKSQFYIAFKKHKGMTPYQFIKKHKKIPSKA